MTMPNDTEITDTQSQAGDQDGAQSEQGDDAPILLSEPDEELHARNLAFLSKHAPSCRALKNHKVGAELQFLDNGEPTIELGGVSLYGDLGAQTFTQKQYDDFWKSPSRIMLAAPDGLGLDSYSKPFVQGILRTIADNSIDVYTKVPGRRADHAVVWGVGLGAHLHQILEDTQCHNILLVEPNLEFIYHSTFIFDWERFFKKAEAQNCTVRIIATTNVKEMVSVIRQMLISRNVMTVDGTLLYTHYPNKFFSSAQNKLGEDIASFFMALGYAEDEFFMLSHTYMNFMKKDAATLFQQAPKPIRDIPVIIVGGGPSKDDYFDVLRANQDKAIIVSCGSALDTLLSEDIKPDFHFLLERGTGWHGVLKPTTDLYDMSDVCLVASSTVDPRVQDMFGDAVFFYRPALSPYKMFGKPSKAVLIGCDPQVGNAGFSFALHTGFDQIYLFGLDLGSRNPEVHHSRNSAPMRGEVRHHTLSKELPATLGGVAYTTNHLLLVRDNIENMLILHNKQHKVFNCGDGIIIRGTTPKIPRKLALPPLNHPKRELVDQIKSNFKTQSKEEFRDIWTGLNLREQTQQIHDTVLQTFEDNPDILGDDFFYKLHKSIIFDESQPQVSPIIIYRGNIHMMMMAAWYYLTHTRNEKNYDKMCETIRKQFTIHLGKMLADTHALLDQLSAWDDHGIYPLED